MQAVTSPFGAFLLTPYHNFNGELRSSNKGFDGSRVLYAPSLRLFQAASAMDLSKVGGKILSSVRSSRLLPSTSGRPEVPARAAAAAAVARALASLSPDQRLSLPSSSAELSSMYGSGCQGPIIEELEEEFYEEDFDPVVYTLVNIPAEEGTECFENKATTRLAQLDRISARLSRHVMEHHEEMVKGIQLVKELQRDLKIATIICMNGRRHLTSSMQEVSRDLIVTTNSKKKEALLDLLPILTELRHALDMQKELEALAEEANFCKAFQVLSEYLQLLDTYSELSVVQEMSRGVEVWLGNILQKLDSLLLQVCQVFKEEKYITVIDAYALIGDVSGLAEKIRSYFMQEVLSETHSALKVALIENPKNFALKHTVPSWMCYASECYRPFIEVPSASTCGIICSTRGSGYEQLANQASDVLSVFVFSEAEVLILLPSCSRFSSRLTYGDLCLQMPESKFRLCLLRILAVLFRLMCSYYAIMSFQPEIKMQDDMNKQCEISHPLERVEIEQMNFASESCESEMDNGAQAASIEGSDLSSSADQPATGLCAAEIPEGNGAIPVESVDACNYSANSSRGSPWYDLRRDAAILVSQSLQRGRKNIWQLSTSRVSVLLSSTAFCSTSIHQFLRNYEDLNIFVLAGEAFCGDEAAELRTKLKAACDNYYGNYHKQNISVFRIVLEKECWQKLPPDVTQVVSFAGLVGDEAPFIASSDDSSASTRLRPIKAVRSAETGSRKSGFSYWRKSGNPFLTNASPPSTCNMSLFSGDGASVGHEGNTTGFQSDKLSPSNNGVNCTNGDATILEDENEELLADFIDEDSQLPSRRSRLGHSRSHSLHWRDDEATTQTGSSLCLLRFMDKYARLMQKLGMVNVEFFKGLCQLFEIYYYYVFQTFCHQDSSANGKGFSDNLNYRLKTTVNRISQDCEQWLQPQSPSSSPLSYKSMDPAPTSVPESTFGLKERCTAVDTMSFVARVLHRSKPHLQSMLLQNNPAIVEDFFVNLVDTVPDLTEHIHRRTARLLLHIDGFIDRIANAKWEVKELGLEHNGYVDLLLEEFKHYRTRLAHGDIYKEVQEQLLDYGVEHVAVTLVEGLSRVKRCTDEGRALMSLDLQVLINGLQHIVLKDVKPKLQVVETFIKAYYLPATEYVNWARAHPEYSKNQVVGLINLVAYMKGWKRKTRLGVLEKLE